MYEDKFQNTHMVNRSSKLTLQEIIDTLVVHDESLSAIADDMKKHSLHQATWAAYTREVRMELLRTENELEQTIGRLVTEFSRTASSATAVQNYAKYEVVTNHDVVSLKNRIAEIKNNLSFCTEVYNVMSRRCDLLIALAKIDHNVIVSSSGPKMDGLAIREQIVRFNRITEIMSQPWGRGKL